MAMMQKPVDVRAQGTIFQEPSFFGYEQTGGRAQHTGRNAPGNVGQIFEGTIDNADVILEGTGGGRNYVFKGSVKNSSILIRGGGDNYIFQGSVQNSAIRIKTTGRNNVIFQDSVNNSDVRIEGAGGDLCLFQGSIHNSTVKDRGEAVDSRFMFCASVSDSVLDYNQSSATRMQGHR